jgi:hypothetical protein
MGFIEDDRRTNPSQRAPRRAACARPARTAEWMGESALIPKTASGSSISPSEKRRRTGCAPKPRGESPGCCADRLVSEFRAAVSSPGIRPGSAPGAVSDPHSPLSVAHDWPRRSGRAGGRSAVYGAASARSRHCFSAARRSGRLPARAPGPGRQRVAVARRLPLPVVASCACGRSQRRAATHRFTHCLLPTAISNVFGRDEAPDGPGPMQTLDRSLISVSLEVVA